nr:hypothetical protein [Tanacetum cinerariifolium]
MIIDTDLMIVDVVLMIAYTVFMIVEAALMIFDVALIPGFLRENRRPKTGANATRDHACTQINSWNKRLIRLMHSESMELILKESLNYYGEVAVVE